MANSRSFVAEALNLLAPSIPVVLVRSTADIVSGFVGSRRIGE
jgi:hypothetical protein